MLANDKSQISVSIVSFYAVTNIGDKILTDTLAFLLKQKGVNRVNIVDINGRYVFKGQGILRAIEKFYVRHIRRISFEDHILKGIKNSDLIIFGGGALFDFKVTDVIEKINAIVKLAEQLKIPVVFHSVGLCGRVSNSSQGKSAELRQALLSEATKYISVRERQPEIANLLQNSKPVHLSFDTAIWCKDAYGIRISPRKCKRLRIGINIIHPDAFRYDSPDLKDEELAKLYMNIYKRLSEDVGDCWFYTNGVDKDNTFADYVMEKAGISKKKFLPVESSNGRKFLQLLSSFDSVVSSRLHSSICCYSLQIPSIGLCWDEKMRIFYQRINCPNLAFSFSPTIANDMVNALKSALQCGYDLNLFDNHKSDVLESINCFLS